MGSQQVVEVLAYLEEIEVGFKIVETFKIKLLYLMPMRLINVVTKKISESLR